MAIEEGLSTPPNFNQTHSLIERFTRPSLSKAIAYFNADRDQYGKEDMNRRWFQDLDVVSYTVPFSRHVDGLDHTHFMIDIDVRLKTKKRDSKYEKYEDRLRLIKLEAAIRFFKGWVEDHPHHNFLWKVGSSGLHAIQRINKRIERQSLLPLITKVLFQACDKVQYDGDSYTAEEWDSLHHCDSKCLGWHYRYKQDVKGYYNKQFLEWSKYYTIGKHTFRFFIDMRYFLYDKNLIRWVYSPVFKIPGQIYYSIPIKKWNIKYIRKYSQERHVAEIIEPFEIPEFSFYDHVELEEIDSGEWIERKTPNLQVTDNTQWRTHSRYSGKYDNLKLHDVDAKLPYEVTAILDRMTRDFQRRNVSPCIKAHYEKATTERGAHFNRFVLVRFLIQKEYNIHQVANWIRFRLNDERDNAPENRRKLRIFLPVVVGDPDKPDTVPGCHIMQTPNHEFGTGICDEKMKAKCGRFHPLAKGKMNFQKKRVDTQQVFEEIPLVNTSPVNKTADEQHWEAIVNKINQALDMDKNLILHKSTRAGVTTTMIYAAFKRKKKLLVLVPNNRIATDTFGKAMTLTRNLTGLDIKGAVLAKNSLSCLLLKFLDNDLYAKKGKDPNWGAGGIAWRHMVYHNKPECKSCRYKTSTVSLPLTNFKGDIIPLYDSQVLSQKERSGWCAYQTFRRNVHELDVAFITYAKLQSLRQSNTKENLAILSTLINEFEVLFLDEINQVAQASPLKVPLLVSYEAIDNYDMLLKHDIFSKLRTEIDRLVGFASRKVDDQIVIPRKAEDIKKYIEKFISRFEPLKLKDWEGNNVSVTGKHDIVMDNPSDPLFEHPLTYPQREELRENFGKYHVMLENYVKSQNRTLYWTERVLMLLTAEEFVGFNLPNMGNDYLDYHFIIEPNIREVRGFVRDYTKHKDNNRVIATDASLPEANIKDLLGITFGEFLVGDPRKTNHHQLIVADAHKQYPNLFLNGRTECVQTRCDYWNTIHGGCQLKMTLQTYKGGDINIHAEETALKDNGRCIKNQFLFLKDVQAMINAYEAKNIFVILPNKKIFRWFRYARFFLRNIKGLKLSYFRSDLTVGVESDRRIMVTLGNPIPPKNSYLWLAYYYHRMNLLTQYTMPELAEKLRLNSMRSAFWQTVGRAKDPLGKVRSFVLSWGLGIDALVEAFNFDPVMKGSLPHYLPVDSRKYRNTDVMQLTSIFRKTGTIATPTLLRLSRRLSKSDATGKWFTQRQLHNRFAVSYNASNDIAEKYTPEQLKYFNLSVQKRVWGHRYLTSIGYFVPEKT